MPTILEQPSVRRVVMPLTVEQYHCLGDAGLISQPVELLQGILVEKMPKSPLHTWLVNRLIQSLRDLAAQPLWVRKEDPLTLGDSEPEPDVSVVRGNAEDFLEHHPNTAELVIEVAISTLEVDREKAAIYAAAGVPEYWIVLAETRQIEVFLDPAPSGYRLKELMSAPSLVRSRRIPAFAIKLPDLFEASGQRSEVRGQGTV